METPFVSWVFSGFSFVKARTAIATSVATKVLTKAVGGVVGGFVVSSAMAITYSFYGGAAVAEDGQAANAFHREYGIWPKDLRSQSRSVIPFATRFHDLKQGDTLLEIVLKAKRGMLASSTDGNKMRALLEKVLSFMPGSGAEKAIRLDRAIKSSRMDMQTPITLGLLNDWSISAGREGGDHGYCFGDLTKSAINTLIGSAPQQTAEQKLNRWFCPAEGYKNELFRRHPRASSESNSTTLVDDSSLSIAEHVCLHYIAASASRFAYETTPPEGGHFEWNDHHFSVEYSGVTMLPQDGANNIGQKVALVATVKSSATLRNGRLRVLLLAFKGTSGFSLN